MDTASAGFCTRLSLCTPRADPAHNAAVNAAYLSQLPLKSEAAVDAFIDAGYAVEIDTGHYFLCSVVDVHAAG
jgi:hypothetical protein